MAAERRQQVLFALVREFFKRHHLLDVLEAFDKENVRRCGDSGRACAPLTAAQCVQPRTSQAISTVAELVQTLNLGPSYKLNKVAGAGVAGARRPRHC